MYLYKFIYILFYNINMDKRLLINVILCNIKWLYSAIVITHYW